MPKELIAIAAGMPTFLEYEERPLKPDEGRIRSIFSSPKHGTELRAYHANTEDYTSPFDHERGIHLKGRPGRRNLPIPLGDMTVGIVLEIGEEVTRFRKGDRVFDIFPFVRPIL